MTTSGPRRAATNRTAGQPGALGWRTRSLLAWGLTGWAFALVLGVLLLVHVTSRDEFIPAPPTKAPSGAVPIEEMPAPATPRERTPLADEGATVSPIESDELARLAEPVEVESDRAQSSEDALIAAYLRHAALFTEAREFERAIESYDLALQHDPENVDFALLRAQVVEMRASVKRGGSAKPLAIREGRTEYVPPSGDGNSRHFAESVGGVSVRRATSAPEFPGELVVSLRPRALAPGDPYVVSVRVYNKGNRPIGVEHVEVVFELNGRSKGRGDREAPIVGRANPRDTSLLWEKSGVWAEGQSSGRIDVTAYLINGAQLKKTIAW